MDDVKQLASIAKDEPQISLTAYSKALCMRWCFVQRTISNISHLFQPLEEVIREELIPAIVGRKISDVERKILALPVRFGGIGILNPMETAEIEFNCSLGITAELKNMIYNQETTLENYNEESVTTSIKKMKADKENRLETEFDSIKAQVSESMMRNLDLTR